MQEFADMFEKLDQSTGTNEKVRAMVAYFSKASIEDQIWATLLLRGKVKRKPLTARALLSSFQRLSKTPDWMLAECRNHVGDSGETIALLMNAGLLEIHPHPKDLSLHQWMTEELVDLRRLDDRELDTRLLEIWTAAKPEHWFLLNKIMSGAFRVGVSEKLVLKALSQVTEEPEAAWHQWLLGKNERDFAELERVFRGESRERSALQAVPFCLASPIEAGFFEENEPHNFIAEWKWDGIRSQVIKKGEHVWIWSRGEEMITDAFPEIRQMASAWRDDAVLDGELLVWGENRPRDFADLQQRLGRKKLTHEVLERAPVAFMAYDILHRGDHYLTQLPFEERRRELEVFHALHDHSRFRISNLVPFSSWDELKELQSQARERGAEGLMLKNKHSAYITGRKRGVWWKFKVNPYTLDAVLLYAQAGSGKRSNLFTDYTFALWEKDKLVPFAKAYSGLDNKEIEELDRWIRRNTLEKFGPVRSLRQEHVFEIAFEGIARSTRHKSGIAVRFPRILRWRRDKKVQDADNLDEAWKLIRAKN